MLALAFLTIAATTEHADHPPPDGQIPVTRNEIAALFSTLIIKPVTGTRAPAAMVCLAATPPAPRPNMPLPAASGQRPMKVTGRAGPCHSCGMQFLLLPSDEQELVAWLCGELGLKLLLSDALTGGYPATASDPIAALPESLPLQARPFQPRGIYELTFWHPGWGVNNRDPQRVSDARDRVAGILTRGSAAQAGADADTLLDPARTPVLRLRRCVLRDAGCLEPAGIQGMALPARYQPAEVLRLRAKTERWLRRGSTRFAGNRPHLTHESSRSRPTAVYASRHATAWIHSGGRFCPEPPDQ
jgi:hypothetical protein